MVLPVPGGPQSSADVSRSDSTRRRSGRPGPTRCAWPDDVVDRARAKTCGEWCARQLGLLGGDGEQVVGHQAPSSSSTRRYDERRKSTTCVDEPVPLRPTSTRVNSTPSGSGSISSPTDAKREPSLDLAHPAVLARTGRPFVGGPLGILADQIDLVFGSARSPRRARATPPPRGSRRRRFRPGAAATHPGTSLRSNAITRPLAFVTMATTLARKCMQPIRCEPTTLSGRGRGGGPGRRRSPEPPRRRHRTSVGR